jgi:hypothetical protein
MTASLLRSKQFRRLVVFRQRYWLPALVAVLAIQLPANAQHLNKAYYFSHGTVIAGNNMYEVVIEDTLGEGIGLYTVRTGPSHQVTKRFGKPQDLLGGGSLGLPGTSYTTIRSYNTKTDYVQSEFAASDPEFSTVWLDNTFISDDSVVANAVFIRPIPTSVNPTGYRVIYNVPGLATIPQKQPGVIPDTMEITQVINVHGRNIDDSWVEITTIVKNKRADTLKIGIRYLWDLLIAGDDGPVLTQKSLGGQFGQNESSLSQLDFAFFVAAANDFIDVAPPAYNVFGSMLTPANLLRAPFLPVTAKQVSWLLAFFNAFDYATHSGLDVTTPNDPNAGVVGGDNAILYFWGDHPENALRIPPGGSVQVTQALFAALPNRPPGVVLDQNPPVCQFTIAAGPPKRIRLQVNDVASGLQSVRVVESFNLKFKIPTFEIGTIENVSIDATAIDDAGPTGFSVEMTDLCGNKAICDPIFITLQPALHIFEYRLEPVFADRYFYVRNQGIEQINVNLNGHEFTLSAKATDQPQVRNIFGMPAYGEMTIDILRYLKEDANTMTIAFEGPQDSRADLVLSDLTIKGSVDLVLDLAPVPQQFALAQNLPNPFRSATTIQFEVPVLAGDVPQVELKIYNMLGQLVRTLVDADLPFGSYRQEWDGRDEAGREVTAGVYLYNLNAGNTRLTKKMALIR